MYSVVKHSIPKKEGYFFLHLPKQSKILSVQEREYGDPQLWAFVNHNATMEERKFLHVKTGSRIEENPSSLVHISTFYLKTDNHEGHIFEVKK